MLLRRIIIFQIIQLTYLLSSYYVNGQNADDQQYLFLNQTVLSTDFIDFKSWNTSFTFLTCNGNGNILHQDFGPDDIITLKLLDEDLIFAIHGLNITEEYVVSGNFTLNPVTVQFNEQGENRSIIVGNETVYLSLETTQLINFFSNLTEEYSGDLPEQIPSLFIGCISAQSTMFLSNTNDLLSLQKCTVLQQRQCDTISCQSLGCLNNSTCTIESSKPTCLCVGNYTGIRCEKKANACDSIPCYNNATCVAEENEYTCHCALGYNGSLCQDEINDCNSQPCFNNGACIDLIGAYQCDCRNTGYEGINCEFDVNECLNSNNCSQFANCTNMLGGYKCECYAGYTGEYCDIEIDECDLNPCENNGICMDAVNNYTCICLGDFTGVNCENEIDNCIGNQCDPYSQTCVSEPGRHYCICKPGFGGANCEELNECLSVPCFNEATCVNLINNFTCNCAPGFTGVLCQKEINECSVEPCMNNAQCIDLIADYNCVCTMGWSGKNCSQEFTPCASDPCLNNGICTTLLHTHELGYNCTCLNGYTGVTCEINIDDCLGVICGYNKICLDGINSYDCACNKGFEVDAQGNCTIEINECASNPCENKGTCVDGIGDFYCECVYGYDGKRCEHIIDFCKSNPCLHSAYCNGTLGGYKCFCGDGYIGLHCEYLYDACVSNPCQSGDCKASDIMGVYKCQCYPGYTGVNCEVNIDECASNPCHNAGNCTDLIAGYNCSCVEGWSGDDCDINIDECISNPCVNMATCIDMVAGYACECIPGYSGVSCEINIDECQSQPCFNNGTCTDDIASYACSCNNTGYKGLYCEVEINECEVLSPCYNNATCIDLINDYQCACHEGYYGRHCEMDINECLSNPCQHNSTCLQKSNQTVYEFYLNETFSHNDAAGYICDCTPGYTGILCETEINECKLYNPCLNIASCVDLLNDYECQCSTLFGGKNCSVELIGCNSEHDCLNNGTCVPYLEDEEKNQHNHTCDCASGFTGSYCNQVTSALYSGNSHAIYQPSSSMGNLKTLSFEFRTTVPYGHLFLIEMQNSSLKVFLQNGFISSSYMENNITKFQTIEIFINDGLWHKIGINFDPTFIKISINENVCEISDCVMQFNNTVSDDNFIEDNYLLQFGMENTNTTQRDGYIGCIRDITYNNYVFSTFDAVSYSNISEGCIHNKVCENQDCSGNGECMDWWVDFRCECKRPYIGVECLNKIEPDTFSFGNSTSFAKFELPFVPMNLFDASMFIRTTQGSGILVYIGEENEKSTSIAVELNGGQLQVMFGNGLSFTRSNNLDDGEYHFVSVVVFENVLTLTVDNEIFSDIILSNAINITSNELFIGGQETIGGERKRRAVTEPSQINHFKGAMQDVQFNSYRLLFHPNASAEIDNAHFVLGYLYPTHSSNILNGEVIDPLCNSQPCQNNGICSLTYNDFVCNCSYGWKGKECQDMDFCKQVKCPGNLICVDLSKTFECVGAVTINKSQIIWQHSASNVTSYDQLRLQIKTRSSNSDILFIQSTTLPDGSIRLYLNNEGLLVLVVMLNNYEVINKHNLKINDGKWHDISIVTKSNSHIKIVVDSIAVNGLRTFQESIISTIFSSQNLSISTSSLEQQSIEGCLEDIRIGGYLLPFYNQSQLSNKSHDPVDNPFRLLTWPTTLFKIGCHGNKMCHDVTCHNRGECDDIFNEYVCNCKPGYSGRNCSIDIDECAGVQCLNGGTCMDAINNFACICQSGYTGVNCEIEMNECQSSPCQNNGICDNLINSYLCECNSNFTGSKCEIDISNSCGNDLDLHFPCQNGGICTNISNTNEIVYNCSCAPQNGLISYSGSKCEIEVNLCDKKNCLNNSTCKFNKTLNDAFCECSEKFSGEFCENKILPCSLKPCKNNGTCFDSSGDDFNCTCNKDFVGKTCEFINECNLPENRIICLNNGSCQVDINTDSTPTYSCKCNNNYIGLRCEFKNPCMNLTCHNGGKCVTSLQEVLSDTSAIVNVKMGPTAKCNCMMGFEGKHCQTVSSSYVGYSSVIILGSCIAGVIVILLIAVGLFVVVSTALERRASSGTYSPSKQENVQVSFGLENRSGIKLGVERQLPPSERLI